MLFLFFLLLAEAKGEQTTMKRIYIGMLIVMTLVLALVNSLFYLSTRSTLREEQEKNNDIVANTVRDSIVTNQEGFRLFEGILAKRLYTASVAIADALPPKAEDVTNEQLQELKGKLLVDDITIFIPKGNEFMGYKSTNPDEIGARTKDWGDNWNRMFSQLMENHEVVLEPNFGQKFPNFWAGPTDTSFTTEGEVYKWGYYHDGSTDYIIDPFISSETVMNYQKDAGVDKVIQEFVKDNNFLLQVGILNYDVLKGLHEKHQGEIRTNKVFHHHRLVVNGQYDITSENDPKYAQEAINKNETFHKVIEIEGKQILNSYIPLDFQIDGNYDEDKTVMIISSDYEGIQSLLHQRLVKLTSLGIGVFVVGLLILYSFYRYARKQGEIITDVQSMYYGNIQRLFNTIKEHRHDFNHHIFTIQGLLSMKRYDETEKYLEHITNIQTSINDVINVYIPAFSGLLKAKTAEAVKRKIEFSHHFEGFDKLNIDITKTTNLVRVLGNILDNAFHSVIENEEDDRKVVVMGKANADKLILKIHNNGAEINSETLPRIFDHGFTTKKEKGGSGIGLASCKKIVDNYKGDIQVNSNHSTTTFIVEIPLSPKEYVQL